MVEFQSSDVEIDNNGVPDRDVGVPDRDDGVLTCKGISGAGGVPDRG